MVAKKVGSAKSDIYVVGSSKLGYSLNPAATELVSRFRKNPIGDRRQSDIDLIIINSDIFYECWNALVSAYYGGFHSYDKHRKDVFRRFVSLRSDEEYPLKSLSNFVGIMGEIKRDIQIQFRLPYPINYRLYRSLSDASAYHEYGVRQLQEALRNA